LGGGWQLNWEGVLDDGDIAGAAPHVHSILEG
jgi:hypothetical protein